MTKFEGRFYRLIICYGLWLKAIILFDGVVKLEAPNWLTLLYQVACSRQRTTRDKIPG